MPKQDHLNIYLLRYLKPHVNATNQYSLYILGNNLIEFTL